MSLATFGKQTAVRVYARKLACKCQTQVSYMKKELTLGTTPVPAHETDVVTKFRKYVNRVLPAECQVKTASDGWYVGAIVATVATLIFPPFVAVVAYCVYRAEKAEKGGAQ